MPNLSWTPCSYGYRFALNSWGDYIVFYQVWGSDLTTSIWMVPHE